MSAGRAAVAMTDVEIAGYLAEPRVFSVASHNADGTIHLVGMYVAHVDGHPCFWTYGRSQKAVNLRRNPSVTLLAESGLSYGDLRGVQLVGEAEIVEEREQALAIGWAVACAYGAPDGPASHQAVERAAAKRVGVRVRVRRTVSWDHSKPAAAPGGG